MQDHPLSKPELFAATIHQRWFNSNLKESLSAAVQGSDLGKQLQELKAAVPQEYMQGELPKDTP
eukprot:7666313-Prorocentrum_lima.AAC.1